MGILNDITIELDPIIDEAKELAETAIDILKNVPISAAQKAVALVKETSLGTAILNLISAASTSNASGLDKFSAVFDAAKDAYDAFIGAGALKGLIDIGLNILRQIIQSIYDDFAAAFLVRA